MHTPTRAFPCLALVNKNACSHFATTFEPLPSAVQRMTDSNRCLLCRVDTQSSMIRNQTLTVRVVRKVPTRIACLGMIRENAEEHLTSVNADKEV